MALPKVCILGCDSCVMFLMVCRLGVNDIVPFDVIYRACGAFNGWISLHEYLRQT